MRDEDDYYYKFRMTISTGNITATRVCKSHSSKAAQVREYGLHAAQVDPVMRCHNCAGRMKMMKWSLRARRSESASTITTPCTRVKKASSAAFCATTATLALACWATSKFHSALFPSLLTSVTSVTVRLLWMRLATTFVATAPSPPVAKCKNTASSTSSTSSCCGHG